MIGKGGYVMLDMSGVDVRSSDTSIKAGAFAKAERALATRKITVITGMESGGKPMAARAVGSVEEVENDKAVISLITYPYVIEIDEDDTITVTDISGD